MNETRMDETTNEMINNKYIIEKTIGKGQFGIVYKGSHLKTREPIAIKMESLGSTIKLLKNETTIINYLSTHNVKHIPIVYWYGKYKDHICTIMPLYECSVSEYIKLKSLTPSKIYMIMLKTIEIIENVHNNFVIHRDMKPDNIMIRQGELFLIDFGFSTFYINEDKEHIPYNDKNMNMLGTPNYVSINIHNGIEATRRDDMISLGYMFLYLFYEKLPWENTTNIENQSVYPAIHIYHPKNIKRKELKSIEHIETLCAEIKPVLWHYIKYCYSLKYDEEPAYNVIKQLLEKTI
jgi:serine/threonine protein kinase